MQARGLVLEAVEQPQVGRVVLRRKARHRAADVLGLQPADVAQAATEEAARQRAEGDEGHAQLAAGVQRGDLGVARPQRVLGL